MRKVLLGVALALWLAPAANAAPTRILYAGTWTGHTEIYAVDPTGRAAVAQLTHWRGACPEPPYHSPVALNPSPNGRFLAVNCGAGLWLMRTDGRDGRELVPVGSSWGGASIFARWSPDSRFLAYALGNGMHVIDPMTGRERPATGGDIARLHWLERGVISPNGRWVVQVGVDETTLVRLRDGVKRVLPGAVDARWSPDSTRLALELPAGIEILDMRTNRMRLLTSDIGFQGPLVRYELPGGLGISWAPDGRSIAYVKGRDARASASWTSVRGDLRTVSTKGRVKTLVRADRAYGGAMSAVAWVKVAQGSRYSAPQQEPSDRIAPTGLLANGPIGLLAADGDRVAFEACDAVAVWTPATGALEGAPQPGSCYLRELTGRYYLYDLAIAGDRLVYALNVGCNSITITLTLRVLASPSSESEIGKAFGNCGTAFGTAYGRAAGSGGLLVFGEWSEVLAYLPPFPVRSATVRRVDGSSCPCPALMSTGGPLYPADVDDGRVLVYGDNETIVLDRDGNKLVSFPVSPQAAQLAGVHAVLLVHGQLRDYDVRSAALLHTWNLPDVPAGPVCGWRLCFPQRLTLNDAKNGLVAYILDGKLHVLRLADGADAVVGQASLARFMEAGLVFADGSRLRLVPFSQLPLRGFDSAG
jgi:hypothetical protein